MVAPNKIDSNTSGLRLAEELGASIGLLSGSEVWNPQEPNSYSDFGTEVVTVARAPINAGRQRKKGVKTDENAAFGWNTDLTQINLVDILEGFFFADLRPKGEEVPTQATGTTDLFDVASTTGFFVGSLIFSSGFVNAGNNGLHLVTAVVADTTVEVLGSTLVTETPPATANLVVVGFEFAAGDFDAAAGAGGNFPTFTTTVKDLTELGFIPGEFYFSGGDDTGDLFTNAANNGFKRARTIVTNTLTIDKSDAAIVTEDTTTETIRIFFGRVLKNEIGTLIKRRTFQAELQLGAPDTAQPTEIQALYVKGGVASEATFNMSTADKINVDVAFLGTSEDRIDGPTALKAGTRPTLLDADAFNTSSDVKRVALTQVSSTGDEDPTPLFGFVQEFTININNVASGNKAIGVAGSFDITVGDFEVGGSITAYFSDITALTAVNNVDDVSFDFHFVRNNAGISVDMPLITLGNGRPTVEKDEPILIPLEKLAASGSKIDVNLNHTLLMSFYDFLPNAAAA